MELVFRCNVLFFPRLIFLLIYFGVVYLIDVFWSCFEYFVEYFFVFNEFIDVVSL